MSPLLASTMLTGKADDIATWCFILGGVVVALGTLVGVFITWNETTKGGSAQGTKEKVKTALQHVEGLKDTAEKAAKSTDVEAAAAADAKTKGNEAVSALKEVEGIIGSLPERLRFAALLVLVGTLMMGVATTQFGGHSIF